jgi:hypothetical protein
MNENSEVRNWLSNRYLGIGFVLVLVVLGIGIIWLTIGQNSSRQLMPDIPSPTPLTQTPGQEPITVTFTELNENPLAYLNQPLVVTGDFLPSENNACTRVVGPDIRWSITGDNLQLDVVGFERVVRLLSPGTTLTIQGIWRFYQGSLGCGKAPPQGTMWYLEVRKIVEPNPLIAENGRTIQVEIITNQPELPAFSITPQPGDTQPVATQTALATMPLGTVSPSPTLTDQIIPTQTPQLPAEITPSATLTPSVTDTAPTNTPDSNATVPVSTATSTSMPTATPASNNPTMTPEPPGVATATLDAGGGYPGPDSTTTPTPTATINPYP